MVRFTVTTRRHVLLCLYGATTAAIADVPSPAPAPAPAPVDGGQVVVTANRLAVQNLIDRKVYTIAADLQSVTGSVSDVLAAIPSVQLDVDGNVSLRGDSNVTVLIDGRPSAQLQGSSLGDVLQQMAANEIERIEVITNPPAQFKAEGTAGIINIVTRRSRPDGGAGSVQANVGNHDRASAAGTGSYKAGAWTVAGSAGLRLDDRIRTLQDHRVVTDAVTGLVTTTDRAVAEEIKRLFPSVKGSIEWKPDRRHAVSLSASETDRRGRGRHFDETDRTAVDGALTAITTRTSDGTEHGADTGATLTYEQTTALKDEKLTASIGQTRFFEREHYDYANASLLPWQGLPGDGYGFSNEFSKRLASVDYARPLPTSRALKVGAAYEESDNRYANDGQLQAPSGAWQDNPLLSNRFEYRQALTSTYGSYQLESSPWTVLAGLRVESARVTLTSYDGGAVAPSTDTRAFPSLHAERAWGEGGTFSINAARRITRPDPESLDPHVDREDIHNLRVGNPTLRAQTAMAYEVGYSVEAGAHGYGLNGYFRDLHDAYTDIVQVIDPSTVLSTRSNIPHSHSAGIEFTANGRLLPSLTYTLSGNLNRYSLTTPESGEMAATSLSTKASVDFRSTLADTWQVAYSQYGRRITPQGAFVPTGSVNLGFRHTIDPRLSAVVTVTDVFNSQAWRRITDTPGLEETWERRPLGRLFFVGVVVQIGQANKKPKRDGAFEYDAGG